MLTGNLLAKNLDASLIFVLIDATPLANAFFGQGSGVIHMDSVECRGTERRLVDCTYRAADAYDYHSEDVGVRCLVGEGIKLRVLSSEDFTCIA